MREPRRFWLVTDFDRINGGMFGDRPSAEMRAEQLAREHPGNTIHVLESVCAFERKGDAVERRQDLEECGV